MTKRAPRKPARRSAKTAVTQKPASPSRVSDQRLDRPKGASSDDAKSIVAVGASAGGLEAFSQLLERLPPDSDLAIVFIQHLSPQHTSALPELLQAKTSLQVMTAASGMRIDPGHVYVIPPNVHMEVLDGELHLLPRPTNRAQFTPIDFFMQSLARWAEDRVIGVILSGTGSDGAAGVREIKAHGGITIAQKPETARHDGMPRASIATGMLDLVLSPLEIADHLSHVRLHPYLDRTTPQVDTLNALMTDGQMRDLFLALRRTSGIDFTQYKAPTIKRRLLRRMALLRLTDIGAYVRYLLGSPAEATSLAQDLLIHVTRFFRDPDSFVAMTTHVFSELVGEQSDEPIRIWVPGCATGEEVYTLGICLLEALAERAPERRIQVFATDVSDVAIEYARNGTYPVNISADVSVERLKRFFVRSDGSYRVVKALRDMCVFARHDLTRDPPFSRLDLVLCRNVLIYLDVALQKRLISVFHYALKSRGFLMLGPAETPGPQSYFAVVDKKWKLFRKTPAEHALSLTLRSELHAPTRSTLLPKLPDRFGLEGKSVQDEATRLILDRYGPPGVIVNANLQIVQFRGRTGPYLEPATGEPNLSVLKMARGGLLHPLRSALQQAKRRSRVVRKEQVHVQRNGDWIEIVLEVVPFATSRGEHYLVLFDEAPAAARPTKGRRKLRRTAAPLTAHQSDFRVSDLRRELVASREYLQSIIQELEAANEELQSANEEILSSNEELQSTNEELDTAKEELQSTNEELNTVNEELHSRNEELTRANSDLTNLLASVDIPIVIVGNDLGIRRFTPRAEELFNLIPSDIGRPIGQINPNFTVEDLSGLIRDTVETLTAQEREVRDPGGRWLSLRIRPYKGIDNRLDGAVLSVLDIDASKRYQALTEKSRDHFRAIVDVIHQPLMVLDDYGRVHAGNARFLELLGLEATDVEGRDLVAVGDGFWDGTAIHDLVAEVLRGRRSVERTVEVHPPKQPRQNWRIRGSLVPLEESGVGVVIAIEDRQTNETA